ncbi:MAG: YhfC family glutamic-type intramembrane protease [Bacillota bacterium]
MISSAAITAMVFTLLICFGMPIALAIWFYRKGRYAKVALFVGAAVFLVSQVFIRIPLLNAASGMAWYQQMAANLFLIALFLSLTAGIFEEVGRYLGFRFFLKKHLTWKNGVAFGIGHGGIEAIVLTGFSYINNLVYSVLINTGAFTETIAPQVGSEMAAYIQNQLLNVPPYMFAVAGLERAFTIIIHIALSLVVIKALVEKRPVFIIYAILLHTIVNLPAVLIPGLGYNILLAELYLLVLAVLGWWFINRSRATLAVETGNTD